tara:strand:+ start:764 stop:1144 length:381 start_codon:yes stop_codon:yes gene_type:complete
MAQKNIFGLFYDDRKGTVCFEDGEVPPVGGDFTFESPKDFSGQSAGPLQFATDETADKLIALLKVILPTDTKIRRVRGGDPPANFLDFERAGIKGSFNAGLIANSLIRSGSFRNFFQDLKIAGILL